MLSTYQAIVQCFPSMLLFAMHLSYVLTMNPFDFRVFMYRLYHNSADSMQAYKYWIGCRYSTFMPFSAHTFLLYYGFSSHMMYTNAPSIFNMMNFSSGVSVLRYAPGRLKIPRLSLYVRQWWDFWIGLPNIFQARMLLP